MHDYKFVPLSHFCMIQDNIALAQKHDAVDTVVGRWILSLKVQMVSLLQIFQIVLISIPRTKLHKPSSCKARLY